MLDGSFEGSTVAGHYQRSPATQVEATFANNPASPTMVSISAIPATSSLVLNFAAQDPSTSAHATISPAPPDVVFTNDSTLPAAGAFGAGLPAARIVEVDLSPDIVNDDGFGNITIGNVDGNITLPANVTLTTAPGGSVVMSGANVDVEGTVEAPGGTLSFTAYDYDPDTTVASTPSVDATRGRFTLGSTGSLSTAGLIIDDRPSSAAAGTVDLETAGGSVAIKAYDVDLDASTEARDAIDVSGGLEVSVASKVTYGKAGSIDIEAGQDPFLPSLLGGQLSWNPNLAQVAGISGSTGGSLTVKAPLIQIGGDVLLNGDAGSNTLWLNATDANNQRLNPDFFDQGGFAAFTLDAIGRVALDSHGNPTGQFLPATLIVPGAVIDPQVKSWQASLPGQQIDLSTVLYPAGQRTPASVTFNDPGVKDPYIGTQLTRGDFVMDAETVIETDPEVTSSRGISINANTILIRGEIEAPGGTISIVGGNNPALYFGSATVALPTVDLAPGSILSAAGAINLVPNSLGYRAGSVLAGGTINVSGNIVAEAGSVLDVSGTSGILDELPSVAGGSSDNLAVSIPVATRVDSAGGTIKLSGSQELFTDATLRGAAGGPTAAGGSLNVSSGIFTTAAFATPLDVTLEVTQDGPTVPASFYGVGDSAVGNAVLDADGHVLDQHGYFAGDSFNNSGFGSLTLAGTVQFSGNVSIIASRSLTVGSGGVIYADGTVSLTAPYVALGRPFESPIPTQDVSSVFDAGGGNFYFPPAYGTGELDVQASLIDVGNLSFQDIQTVRLTADDGDIRGDGTLDLAGNLYLTAGQIYPTTDNTFTIADYDYNGESGNGTVTIATSGTRSLPLSAGGTLDIYASNILQGGVLRAPFGTINLGSGVNGTSPIDYISGSGVPNGSATATLPATQNLTLASGSITSVSAVDPSTGQALVLPYGTNENGVTWLDPAGSDITLAGNGPNALPAKSINLAAVHVTDQANALVDISGGGDLFAASFVTGTNGTQDILASGASFAIIPGYGAGYAPYYSSTEYSNSSLAVGEQVYLNASSGLPAGSYTLLPAQYALAPGAYLITPESSTPVSSALFNANGTSTVAGYEFNGFDSSVAGHPLISSFLVESPAAISARANYDVLTANTFLRQTAASAGITTLRIPTDAGQLVLAATHSLVVSGEVNSQAAAGGEGGLVDIASPSAILVAGPNADLSGVAASTLVLDSASLTAFGADSLLIGGYRVEEGSDESAVVTTSSLTVDNAGATADVDGQTLMGLSGPDMILVSNETLTLAPGAEIESAGNGTSAAVPLVLNGNGAFLRVSASPTASTIRQGANTSTTSVDVTVGAGAIISGAGDSQAGSITLDSTYGVSFDSTATLAADTINLDAGQISLELTPPAVAPVTVGLVLSGHALTALQSGTTSLSLLSYSSLDIFGSGDIGAPAAGGTYALTNLTLHAAEIRGFSNSGGGGTVTINAQNVSLDNSADTAGPGITVASSGQLSINSDVIHLGVNPMGIDQFSDLVMNATSDIVLDPETKTTEADTSVVDGTGGYRGLGQFDD